MKGSTKSASSQNSMRTCNDNEKNSHTNILFNILNHTHSSAWRSECNLQCVQDAWETLCHTFHSPYPVRYPFKRRKVTDPLLAEFSCLQQYQLKCEKIKAAYKYNLKSKKNSSKVIDCYKTFNEYLEQESDGDQQNKVKWYYTAGSLDLQKVGKDDVVLFHVVENSLFSISNIQRKEFCWTPRYSENIGNNSRTIYQIETMQKSPSIFAYVRHKYNISLYTVIETEGKFFSNIIDTNFTDLPFIGLSPSKEDNNEYATVDVEHTVSVWDCSYQKRKLRIFHNENSDSKYPFAQVLYHNANTIAYLDPSNFYLIDTRQQGTYNTIDRSKLLPDTDRFASMCSNTENELYYYFCTENCIMYVDIRTMGIVNTWAHSFTRPPFLSCFLYHAGCNVVCVSSSQPNEKLFLCHKEDKSCVPRRLPALSESFDSCIVQNPNLDTSLHIRERLEVSTAGIQILEIDKNCFTIFSANCLGDIFSHDLTNFQENEETTVNKFQDWNSKINSVYYDEDNLEFVDKLFLRDMPIDVNNGQVKRMHKLNGLSSKICLADLKSRKKTLNVKIHEIWYEKSDTAILEDIEELPRDVTITKWLNEFSNL